MNRTLRTAIATLVAAFSVAVMLAPVGSAQDAPPNAPCVLPPLAGTLPSTYPLSASLSVTYAGGGWFKVVVSGVLRMCSYAEAYQLFENGNRIEYTLWGVDPASDEELYGPVRQSFDYVFRVDEQGRTRVYFSHSIQLAWHILDEDYSWPPFPDGSSSSLAGRDEVYADVRFANSWSGSIVRRVQTPTLYGFF